MQAELTRVVVALFVPGDRPERFAKAAAAGADAIVIDIEDAVAPDRKVFARASTAAALAAGQRAYVRVNAVGTPDGDYDLAMLHHFRPVAVLVAKVGGADDIARVRQALPGTPIVGLIESIAGMRHIDDIAQAPGVAGIAFGGFDLCAELGARVTPEVLAPWRTRTVFAARGAGIVAIDTPFVTLDDDVGLAADARRSVDFGFDGKLCVHPKHIPTIRAAFEPTSAEIAHARAVVGAAASGGVTTLDGQMIDAPIVAAARRVLARVRA